MIRLLWAIHNHQPVGNFDFVFARAYERAYLPFLEVLKKHPKIGVSFHFSGILLDWLEANRPEYLSQLKKMVSQGQVELLGGGYYEPILTMLPDEDKEGQIRKLSRRIESLFGTTPRGMWLAERVWEPSLVSTISRCGIEYVILDGSHFKMVGKTDDDLSGYFETEDQGYRIKLLPIHDAIRDTIPFRNVEDVLGLLQSLEGTPQNQVVFGDDGEKFGEWPQTYDTVYTDGWLERFFSAIEAKPSAYSIRPLQEGIASGKNLGLVYLPPASYQEMMVWAQNPVDIANFRRFKQWIKDSGKGEEADRYVRGTFWRNFLSKYPESNRLHKQGLRLLQDLKTAKLVPKKKAAIQDHLWQSQCNCAYWHGVFGGLYLPHLRFALYHHLIAAQKGLDPIWSSKKSYTWEEGDWDFDGKNEFLLNTSSFLVSFDSSSAVDQFWLKRTGINLCDTLTRRLEAYHTFIASGPSGGAKLEEQIRSKEAGLENELVYDQRVRKTFSEWYLPSDTDFQTYRTQSFQPILQVVYGKPKVQENLKGQKIFWKGEGCLPEAGVLKVGKSFFFGAKGGSVEIGWRFQAVGGKAKFLFLAESLFCLLAGKAPDRYVSWEKGKSRAKLTSGLAKRLCQLIA